MNERPLELPELGAPVADTHAHLDMLEDPASALARAAQAGVTRIVTVVDPTEEPATTFDSLGSWREQARESILEDGGDVEPPEVRLILGVHPHNAKDLAAQTLDLMRDLLLDARVGGIGEIGLDYHYDHSPRDVQRAAFESQLGLAHERGLPVVVHLREAHDDGEAVLRSAGVPEAGCLLHCFTGDAPLLVRFLELGCHVSFAGPVTFKKADSIREAVAAAPVERVLLETDCPFMAPEPYRGRTNEPALVVFTARRVAAVLDMTAEELAHRTSDTARRFFGFA